MKKLKKSKKNWRSKISIYYRVKWNREIKKKIQKFFQISKKKIKSPDKKGTSIRKHTRDTIWVATPTRDIIRRKSSDFPKHPFYFVHILNFLLVLRVVRSLTHNVHFSSKLKDSFWIHAYMRIKKYRLGWFFLKREK